MTITKQIFGLAFAGALGLMPAPANADSETGNDLYKWCRGSDQSLCLGYVIASVETLLWWQIQTDQCFNNIPNTATYGQIRDVVVKFLSDNPAKRDAFATILVSNAVQDAWPCKEAAK